MSGTSSSASSSGSQMKRAATFMPRTVSRNVRPKVLCSGEKVVPAFGGFAPRNVRRNPPPKAKGLDSSASTEPSTVAQFQDKAAPAISACSTSATGAGKNVPIGRLNRCRRLDEFEELDQLGKGEFGVVKRARDRHSDGKDVALKELGFDFKGSDGFPLEALREISILSSFEHPNIVTVLDVATTPDMTKWYLVMELVEYDLATLILGAKRMPLSEGQVKELMYQLLSALEALHNGWVMHRDLKTHNVVVNSKGVLKLIDFGLARRFGKKYGDSVKGVVMHDDRHDADDRHGGHLANVPPTPIYRPPMTPRPTSMSEAGAVSEASGGGDADMMREMLGTDEETEPFKVPAPVKSRKDMQSEKHSTEETTPSSPARLTTVDKQTMEMGSDDDKGEAPKDVGSLSVTDMSPADPLAKGSSRWETEDDTSDEEEENVADQVEGPATKPVEEEEKKTTASPPRKEYGTHTPRVVSGHYRPPEVLLGARNYDSAVDLWSAGCIFAELLARRILFEGSDEMDQLHRIFTCLREPTPEQWPEYKRLCKAQGYCFKPSITVMSEEKTGSSRPSEEALNETRHERLRARFPAEGYDPRNVHADVVKPCALDDHGFKLLSMCLECNPSSRMDAPSALKSQWFTQSPFRERLCVQDLEKIKKTAIANQQESQKAAELAKATEVQNGFINGLPTMPAFQPIMSPGVQDAVAAAAAAAAACAAARVQPLMFPSATNANLGSLDNVLLNQAMMTQSLQRLAAQPPGTTTMSQVQALALAQARAKAAGALLAAKR